MGCYDLMYVNSIFFDCKIINIEGRKLGGKVHVHSIGAFFLPTLMDLAFGYTFVYFFIYCTMLEIVNTYTFVHPT